MNEHDLKTQSQLPSVMSLTYPFREYCFTDLESEIVRQAFASLQNKHQLYEDPTIPEQVVTAYVSHCGIPDSDPESIRIITEFVALIMFFNDGEGPNRAALIDESLKALLGMENARNASPSTSASAELRKKLAPYLAAAPANAAAFLHCLAQTWLAGRWEATHLAQPPRTIDEYSTLRAHTIAVHAYLEAWKLLHEFPFETRARFAAPLHYLESLSTKAQYLANDLASTRRDMNRKQQNYVLLLAATGELDIEAAWQDVRAAHDQAAIDLDRGISALRSESQDAHLHKYLDQIQACTWGNLRGLQLLTNRYWHASERSAST